MLDYHIKIAADASLWQDAEASKSLLADEIHLWSTNLNGTAEQLTYYWEVLNKVEQDRALRFKFEKHKNQFIIGRGKLRYALASYILVKAQNISFVYNEYGKPTLADTSIRFNLSHSGGAMIMGFTLEDEIGVDVELVKKDIEIKKLSSRFFSPAEAKVILESSVNEVYHNFYKCWTRKEAFIKGHGKGLGLPLDQFQVSILEDEIVEIKNILWDPLEVQNWNLYSFEFLGETINSIALQSAKRKKILFFH